MLLHEPDPVIALALDQAVALRVLFDEARAMKEAQAGKTGMLPPGMRYETEGEILKLVN